MSRLLLDRSLAPLAATILRQHGFEAVHVSEIGMERSDEGKILEHGATVLRNAGITSVPTSRSRAKDVHR